MIAATVDALFVRSFAHRIVTPEFVTLAARYLQNRDKWLPYDFSGQRLEPAPPRRFPFFDEQRAQERRHLQREKKLI